MGIFKSVILRDLISVPLLHLREITFVRLFV